MAGGDIQAHRYSDFFFFLTEKDKYSVSSQGPGIKALENLFQA